MIYITGDTHSDFKRFNKDNFPEQNNMTKEDYVIICGDFGGIWDKNIESKNEKYWLNWIENKPFTTLFIDGNHENFDRLNNYEIQEWHGGKVHFIRPSVIHLTRGQVFNIEGKKFFTFGGAKSHDIQGGILDRKDPDFKLKKKKLDKGIMPYRINHETWWKEEMPTKEEMDEGIYNLSENNYKVDFILTHSMSSDILEKFDSSYETDYLTDYLSDIENITNYDIWFCGHYHENLKLDKKHICLYEQIVNIPIVKQLDRDER